MEISDKFNISKLKCRKMVRSGQTKYILYYDSFVESYLIVLNDISDCDKIIEFIKSNIKE